MTYECRVSSLDKGLVSLVIHLFRIMAHINFMLWSLCKHYGIGNMKGAH